MTVLEIEGFVPEFRYKILFSCERNGWAIHQIRIIFKGVPHPVDPSPSTLYPSDSELFDHILSRCDTIARRLFNQ